MGRRLWVQLLRICGEVPEPALRVCIVKPIFLGFDPVLQGT